ncbi:hypothetical protein DCAR_0623218 [Daucus carota subsp. sativus]|uniref:Uncharacterized protein n=1 Tax=Daucus carota subsp. sativus TaxID=79200 RepID=A0AAF1B406_DAUCS|nr:hypothetical protein DCAR_0623218 [Daucus carota subsp. sativus]
MEIRLNSYHHRGVKKLAQRFMPMAFAHDGLVEGIYDPDAYNLDEGNSHTKTLLAPSVGVRYTIDFYNNL